MSRTRPDARAPHSSRPLILFLLGLILFAVRIPAQVTTAPIYSIASDDGWVRGPAVATVNATSAELRIGDDIVDRPFVSILSFDCGPQLPPMATIQSVELHLTRGISVDPTTDFGVASMILKTGAFSDNAALEISDRTYATGVVNAGTLVIGALDGDASTSPLNPAGVAAINLTGLTQIRLEYANPTDANATTNYHVFESGDAPISTTRPYLLITYLAPSPTATASPTPTPSHSPSPTATPTASPTASPSNTPSPTPTDFPTGSPTLTVTASPSPTVSPSSTPSPSPSAPPENAARGWNIYE